MARYFREAPGRDAAWALWFLTGRRPKRLLGVRALVGWTLELTGTPDWLFGECYAVVGDLAECIALLLDDGTRVTHPDETPLSRRSLASEWRSLAVIKPMRHRASITSRSALLIRLIMIDKAHRVAVRGTFANTGATER